MQIQVGETNQRWLVRPERRPQAGARIFCLPHAGSGAAAYRPWQAQLPPSVELSIVLLPGREARIRERPFSRMGPLIAALAPAIAEQLDRPYAIFGHSMGALVAFELARELRRRGARQPACLLVSGRRAPQLPDADQSMHALPDDAFVAEMARRYSGIPQAILDEPELMRLFLPTLRADLETIETYTYRAEEPLACPIVALGGAGDARVSEDGLRQWRAQTSAAFRTRVMPGDHFYVQRALPALAAEVVGALEDAAALEGAER